MVATEGVGGGFEELVATDGAIEFGEDHEVGDRQGDDGLEGDIGRTSFELGAIGFAGVIDHPFHKGLNGQQLHFNEYDRPIVQLNLEINDALLEAGQVRILIGIQDFEILNPWFSVIDDRIQKPLENGFAARGAKDTFKAKVRARINKSHD